MLTSISVCPAVLRGELLEVHRGGDADRERYCERHDQRQEGADHGAENARHLRLAAGAAREEEQLKRDSSCAGGRSTSV